MENAIENGHGNPGRYEANWRRPLLWCLIIVGVILLASWIVFTMKPAVWTQFKERLYPGPKASVEKKKSPPPQRPRPTVKTVKPPTPATRVQQKPVQKKPERIAKKIERAPVGIPSVPLSPNRAKELDDYMEIGGLYAQKGDYQKAEELFKKVIREKRSSSQAHNNLGFVYLKQGKYTLAERQFKEALKIDPGFVLPYYNLACLYSRKRMDVEALIYLQKASMRDERVKQWATADEDFKRLRSDVVFQELVGKPSPERKEIEGGLQ